LRLGRPAERAFLAAGYDTVEKLAAASDRELLALHGVGQKAIRLIREAQAKAQRSTPEDDWCRRASGGAVAPD
jgi:hypothetical protein